MNPIVDVTALQFPSSSVRGIGVYVRELVTAMKSLGIDFERLALSGPGVPDTDAERLCWVPFTHSLAQPAYLAKVGSRALRGGLPLHVTSIHSLGLEAAASGPVIATVFDLIPLRYPSRYLPTPRSRKHYERYLGALRAADHLVAISDATRRDAIRRLGVCPSRISTVHLAPQAPVEEQPIDDLDPTGDVLLAGGPEPHKNLHLGVQAVSIIPRIRRPRVIVSGAQAAAAWQPLRKLAADLEVDLHHVGFVSREQLRWLNGHVGAVLFPSVTEGFGLPALEALAVGTPLLICDTNAAVEVVGEHAAVLPNRPSAWAATLTEVLDHGAPWAVGGPAQAAKFTWERVARETVAVYRRVTRQETHIRSHRSLNREHRFDVIATDPEDQLWLAELLENEIAVSAGVSQEEAKSCIREVQAFPEKTGSVSKRTQDTKVVVLLRHPLSAAIRQLERVKGPVSAIFSARRSLVSLYSSLINGVPEFHFQTLVAARWAHSADVVLRIEDLLASKDPRGDVVRALKLGSSPSSDASLSQQYLRGAEGVGWAEFLDRTQAGRLAEHYAEGMLAGNYSIEDAPDRVEHADERWLQLQTAKLASRVLDLEAESDWLRRDLDALLDAEGVSEVAAAELGQRSIRLALWVSRLVRIVRRLAGAHRSKG